MQRVLLGGSRARAWEKAQSCRGLVGGWVRRNALPRRSSLCWEWGEESRVLSAGTVQNPLGGLRSCAGWKLCEVCALPSSLVFSFYRGEVLILHCLSLREGSVSNLRIREIDFSEIPIVLDESILKLFHS